MKARKALRCISFILILFLLLGRMSEVLRLKMPGRMANGFYNLEDGSCDVVLLGPSMIQQGCYPLEMWEEYGITAYNLGSGNQSPLATYHMAKEAIERVHPKLLVVEIGQFRLKKAAIKKSYIHYLTDNMPAFSRNRLRMIADYAKEAKRTPPDQLALYIPLTMYHTNWKNLQEKYWQEDPKNIAFGARIGTEVMTPVEEFEHVEADPDFSLSKRSGRYLEQIMDLCDETGTELLFVMMPIPGKAEYLGKGSHKKRNNTAEAVRRVSEERGYTTLNLLDSSAEIGIDTQQDSRDGQHLNNKGAIKFTSWLGNYIRELYELEDHRDDPAYAFYEAAAERYDRYLEEKISGTDTSDPDDNEI